MKANTILVLVLLFAGSNSFSQDFADIIRYQDPNPIEAKMYVFKPNAIPASAKHKIVEGILHASAGDDELLTYLQINPDTINIDQFLKSTYWHIEEFLSNIHFLDIDNDRDLDVIYQMKMPDYERHRIRIFVNQKSHFRSISPPGYFITGMNFLNGVLTSIKTVEIGCCDFHYDIYRKVELCDLSKGLLQITYCTAIPKRIKNELTFDKKLFAIMSDSVELRTHSDQGQWKENKVFLYKNQTGEILAKDNITHNFIVHLEYNKSLLGIELTHIWGWLSESDIQIIK